MQHRAITTCRSWKCFDDMRDSRGPRSGMERLKACVEDKVEFPEDGEL